jgi:2-polyprenyl-3-methyl-5-hydroxy-6-metoxy-1,4-benzoquinol methylase
MIRLAQLYPNSRFAGFDLSAEAIGNARREAAQKGLDNIEFTERDVTTFDRTAEPESFDLITTFDAVHDQARPLDVLKGIHRALKPDGLYLMQDIRGSSHVHKNIGHSLGTFLYTLLHHALHDRVSGPGRRGSGRDVGRGENAGVSRKGWLPLDRNPPTRARHHE